MAITDTHLRLCSQEFYDALERRIRVMQRVITVTPTTPDAKLPAFTRGKAILSDLELEKLRKTEAKRARKEQIKRNGGKR